MERNYVAFISYRHKPLDMKVAETLHKLLERYRVPKELRKNENKNLGIVFRDRDELPLTSNLTEDIYHALDHSEFLIVICTPDTPKSLWVERKIAYFIEKHGRERVLIVLAEGTAEESIPKLLTTIYAEDGQTVLRQIEPLCAYLAEAANKIDSLKKELPRLVAAILGCPYDSLIQRQKRYRAQLITGFSGIVSVVALTFLLMMVKYNYEISLKNEEISQNLLDAQINETKVLTTLSNQQREDGERFEAVKSALAALPGEGDTRPYSADAEAALTNALWPYGNREVDRTAVIEQDEEILFMDLSDDGNCVVTLAPSGKLRCFDTTTTRMLWEYRLESTNVTATEMLEILKDGKSLIWANTEEVCFISMSTGELLHRREQAYPEFMTLSSDETLLLEGFIFDDAYVFGIWDTQSFEFVQEIDCYGENLYSAIPKFSDDNSKLLIPIYDEQKEQIIIDIWNIENWEVECEYFVQLSMDEFEMDAADIQVEVVWLPDNSYMFFYMHPLSESDMYQVNICKYSAEGEEIYYQYYSVELEENFNADLNAVRTDTHIYYVNDKMVLSVKIEDGTKEYCQEVAYPNNIMNYYLRYDDSLVVIQDTDSIIYFEEESGEELGNYPRYTSYKFLSACGKYADKETICLVSSDKVNTILVMSTMENANIRKELVPYAYDRIDRADDLYIYSFPDHHCFVTVDENYIWKERRRESFITIYDADTLEERDHFCIEGYCTAVNISADGKKLFLKDYVYDLEQKKVSNIEEMLGENKGTYDYATDYVNRKSGEPVIMASFGESKDVIYWWEDDGYPQTLKLQYDDTISSYLTKVADWAPEVKIGGNGLMVMVHLDNIKAESSDQYMIFSVHDGTYKILAAMDPLRYSKLQYPQIAVGGTNDWVVFADHDWMLRVYDYSQDEIIKEYPLSVSPDTIEEMIFIAKDKYLLIFQENAQMTVVNMEDGSVAAQYETIYYYKNETFIQVDEEEMALYVCFPYGYATGLKIDMETWADAVEIPGLYSYLKGSKQILQFDAQTGNIIVSPLYSLEELIEQANALVSGVSEVE